MIRPQLGVKTDVLATKAIVKWNRPHYDSRVWCHRGMVITSVLATNQIVKWNRAYSCEARVCIAGASFAACPSWLRVLCGLWVCVLSAHPVHEGSGGGSGEEVHGLPQNRLEEPG